MVKTNILMEVSNVVLKCSQVLHTKHKTICYQKYHHYFINANYGHLLEFLLLECQNTYSILPILPSRFYSNHTYWCSFEVISESLSSLLYIFTYDEISLPIMKVFIIMLKKHAIEQLHILYIQYSAREMSMFLRITNYIS